MKYLLLFIYTLLVSIYNHKILQIQRKNCLKSRIFKKSNERLKNLTFTVSDT